MLFYVYGADAFSQWLMLLTVLVGLILFNEFARRTKWGELSPSVLFLRYLLSIS